MTSNTAAKAAELRRLHGDPRILQIINVWDVVSARVASDVPGTTALATASHSIAASLGYEDGENIPVELMIDAVGRIAASTTLPVSADLESGYGSPGETVRRAIGVGIVGANIEDQARPLPDAVAQMSAVVRAAESEGIDFVLNARTDVLLKGQGRDRQEVLADAVQRGRAFLEIGATNVFVPGLLDEAAVSTLVDGIGWNKVSVINVPGSLPPARLEELGVSRISYGPWTQRVALTAFADAVAGLLDGGNLPEGTRILN